MVAAQQERTEVRRLITGGDPDAPYPVPWLTTDFREASDLRAIGEALIAECEEFAELRWAIEETGFEIRYYWRKKAAPHNDRKKAGTLSKAGGLLKHALAAPYVVQIACDANLLSTAYAIEALVFHELMHIDIERKLKGKGEDKEEVPVLKVKSHDLEMFDAEVIRYGLWRYDMVRSQPVIAQASLPTLEPTKTGPTHGEVKSAAQGGLRLLNGASSHDHD